MGQREQLKNCNNFSCPVSPGDMEFNTPKQMNFRGIFWDVNAYFLILQIGKNGVTGVNVANHVEVAFNLEYEHVIQVKMDKHVQVQL